MDATLGGKNMNSTALGFSTSQFVIGKLSIMRTILRPLLRNSVKLSYVFNKDF